MDSLHFLFQEVRTRIRQSTRLFNLEEERALIAIETAKLEQAVVRQKLCSLKSND